MYVFKTPSPLKFNNFMRAIYLKRVKVNCLQALWLTARVTSRQLLTKLLISLNNRVIDYAVIGGTRVGIDLANWRQEEPTGFDGRRQLSRGGTSRVSREAQARICERLGVQFPGPTRLTQIWAFVRNSRTWLAMAREKAQAEAPRGGKYRGVDQGRTAS